MQTAMTALIDLLKINDVYKECMPYLIEIIDEVYLPLEKQQIIDARNGYSTKELLGITKGEYYYNKTYVSNDNDNSPKEENKDSFGEVSAYSPTQENKPLAYHTIEAYPKVEMPEMSDEKIFNEATDKYVIEDEIEAFFQGAKWYREQLKSKP